MKDDNRKAKLMTIGIAVVLILIICGISVIIHAIHRRDSQETGSKLQEDIMDYANGDQEQGILTQEKDKETEGQDVLTDGAPDGAEQESQPDSDGQGVKADAMTDQDKQPEGNGNPATADTGNQTGTAGQEKPAATGQNGQTADNGSQGNQASQQGSAGSQTNSATSQGGQAGSGESAMVVEQSPNQSGKTIMEEEADKANQKTTAKWQKEANENLAAVAIDLPRQMSEMKGYWEAGNMAAVEDLAYLPRYRAASEKLSGTTKYYYFGDTDSDNRPNGKGLAMYTDNQYYFGEWKNGVRSGNGMWIKFYVYDKNAKAKDSIYLQHSYSGSWANDLPNGDGAEHYDFIDENLDSDMTYNRNFIGNFKNGLYDGEMYITNYHKDGNVKEWSGTAVNGVWQPLGDTDGQGKYAVIVELTNPDNYQWMKVAENKNNGVSGLISAAK